MFSIRLITLENCDRRNMFRLYRRLLKDASDPFTMPEQRFRELFRFSKDAALVLFNEICPYMCKQTKKTFIPLPIRMCLALHYFATGSFVRDIGQDFTRSINKSVVCRCVYEIVHILEKKLMNKWIKFPQVSDYETIKQRFYEETDFPGVIGVIGCTHVRIKRPNPNVEFCYINNKGYHSKNVQLICDYNLKILGGFARFGGAISDSYILEASRVNMVLKQRYENDRNDNSWLLGGSNYPLYPWVITPYSTPTEDEKKFNTIHSQTKNCAERLNGMLKGVFRCLHVGLHTSPQMSGKIINACTVLHNFRKAHGLLKESDIINTQNDNNIQLYISNNNANGIDEELKEPTSEAITRRDRLKSRICYQSNF